MSFVELIPLEQADNWRDFSVNTPTTTISKKFDTPVGSGFTYKPSPNSIKITRNRHILWYVCIETNHPHFISHQKFESKRT